MKRDKEGGGMFGSVFLAELLAYCELEVSEASSHST